MYLADDEGDTPTFQKISVLDGRLTLHKCREDFIGYYEVRAMTLLNKIISEDIVQPFEDKTISLKVCREGYDAIAEFLMEEDYGEEMFEKAQEIWYDKKESKKGWI